MKYQVLRRIADWLGVMVWVVVAVGVISTVVIGIAAATVMAKIGLLLAGLIITAIYALLLLAASRFICLFIDIEGNLGEITALIKKGLKSK